VVLGIDVFNSNLDQIITYSYRHNQLLLGLFVFKQVLDNIVLVMSDGFTIAGAKSGKKLNEFFVFFLDFAEGNELLDDLGSYLVLKKFEVVTEEFLYGALGVDIVFFVCFHCLREEKIDPLSGVHLIDFVSAYRTL
jgi:hypothetical protein